MRRPRMVFLGLSDGNAQHESLKHLSAWSVYKEPQPRRQGKSQYVVQSCGKHAKNDDLGAEQYRYASEIWQERTNVCPSLGAIPPTLLMESEVG